MSDLRHLIGDTEAHPADQYLWEYLYGGHSPTEEVNASPGKTAEEIAGAAWAFYTQPGVQPNWSDLDREWIISSLTRTLQRAGAARATSR